MSIGQQNRVQRGIPAGGRYAATAHGESEVSLGVPVAGREFIENRLSILDLENILNEEQVDRMTIRLNDGRDFSDTAIEALADTIHEEDEGYPASDARDAAAARHQLRLLGHGEAADALERVQQAREAKAAAQSTRLPEQSRADLKDAAYYVDGLENEAYGQTNPAENPIWKILNQDAGRDPAAGELDAEGKAATSSNDIYDHASASDPRVQAGEIFDRVLTGGQLFHRRRKDVYPREPYAMRIQANRPLTDDETMQMAGLMGYSYRAHVRGEEVGVPERDSPHSFVVSADTTKSRSDDTGYALERFEQDLPNMLLEGSPMRSTDRSGPGTKGTRLVEGLGDPNLKFELYYDDVC